MSETSNKAVVAPATAQCARVLIVDDEESLCVALRRVLKSRGFQVATATDALSGLKKISGGGFNVIISDIAMPHMDGISFMRSVRSVDLDIPVIFLTGLPTLDTVKQAIELGAFRYLTKPVDNDQLAAAVSRAAITHKLALLKRQALLHAGVRAARPADTMELQNNFERALAGLWIAYQPIVSAHDGSVFGYEALVRSDEPTLPNPGALIDAAERLGRTVDLGRIVRARAPVPMAEDESLLFVNLHPEELLDVDLFAPDSPLSKLAHRTILEITERATIHDMAQIRDRVTRLRRLGFRIAIDDLGAGYSGLTSFATLEPEVVKLDMTLIRDVDTDPMRQRIVRSMVALCKEVGAQVVAEGIERAGERDTIASLGCDLVQGYFVAPPGKPFPDVNW